MKRLLLLTMMCLFGMFSVNAQETVTIGTKSTVAYYFPFHTWWQYSFSQQIYTSAEINHGAANIQKIKFFTDGTNYYRNIKVYMQNIDKKWFDSNSDWVDVTDADIVFEGRINTSTEIEITLDKPFAYAGGNLLLCIHDITNEDSGSSTKFDAYEDSSTRTICMFDETNSSLPGTGNATGFYEQHCLGQKTVLQITFDGEGTTPEEPGDGEEPEQPADTTKLAAPVVTATPSNDSTIVLTWEAVEGATKYYIYENDEVIGDVTSLFCELRGLEANTEYCFTVTAANDTLESEMSEPACTKTLDVALPEEPEEPGDDPIEPEQPADSTTLAAPTNLRAIVEQDLADYPSYKYKITMMWDAVEGAQGYDVYVNTTKEQDFYFGYTGGTAYVAGSNEETTFEFYVVAFNQDKDIESEPSEICTVNVVDDAVEEMTASFNIYPNPVSDKLYIETEAEIEEVVIYDIYGRVQNLKISETQKLRNLIDVTELNSGVYFVKVVTANGEAVKRIIKN